jgi:hypothetical protein
MHHPDSLVSLCRPYRLAGTIVDVSLAFSATNMPESNASATYGFVAPSNASSRLITVTYCGDA